MDNQIERIITKFLSLSEEQKKQVLSKAEEILKENRNEIQLYVPFG